MPGSFEVQCVGFFIFGNKSNAASKICFLAFQIVVQNVVQIRYLATFS